MLNPVAPVLVATLVAAPTSVHAPAACTLRHSPPPCHAAASSTLLLDPSRSAHSPIGVLLDTAVPQSPAPGPTVVNGPGGNVAPPAPWYICPAVGALPYLLPTARYTVESTGSTATANPWLLPGSPEPLWAVVLALAATPSFQNTTSQSLEHTAPHPAVFGSVHMSRPRNIRIPAQAIVQVVPPLLVR